MGKNCSNQDEERKRREQNTSKNILSFGRAYIIRMNRFFVVVVVVNASMNIAKNTINKA